MCEHAVSLGSRCKWEIPFYWWSWAFWRKVSFYRVDTWWIIVIFGIYKGYRLWLFRLSCALSTNEFMYFHIDRFFKPSHQSHKKYYFFTKSGMYTLMCFSSDVWCRILSIFGWEDVACKNVCFQWHNKVLSFFGTSHYLPMSLVWAASPLPRVLHNSVWLYHLV